MTSRSRSKPFHLSLASLFYAVLLYLFYMAASNMNYIWQWQSVPKYFFYEKEIITLASADGVLSKSSHGFSLSPDDGSQAIALEIDSDAKVFFGDGDFVYQDDVIATVSIWQLGPIVNGLWVTLKISFLSGILMLGIGLLVAFMRLSRHLVFNYIASVYIAFVRGTPLLVQMLLFYFIVANIFELSTFSAGVVSLGVFFGAYMAEILRGAIQSIDKGQMEAAKSLNLTNLQAMRYVILPQAFKRALPTLIGEFISLVKDSSLVSVISLTDLTKVGREIVANTFSPFETWIVIAGVYLSITSLLSLAGFFLERRMKKAGGM